MNNTTNERVAKQRIIDRVCILCGSESADFTISCTMTNQMIQMQSNNFYQHLALCFCKDCLKTVTIRFDPDANRMIVK